MIALGKANRRRNDNAAMKYVHVESIATDPKLQVGVLAIPGTIKDGDLLLNSAQFMRSQ